MELFKSIQISFTSFFNDNFFGLQLCHYLFFFILILILISFNSLIANIIVNRLKVFVSKTGNKVDDTLFNSLIPPLKFLPIVIIFLLFL